MHCRWTKPAQTGRSRRLPPSRNLMSQLNRTNSWLYCLAGGVLLAGLATAFILYITHTLPGPQRANAREYSNQEHNEEPPSSPSVFAVDVVHPQKGMDYEVEQPGSVLAYETVQLHAKVSGFLQSQSVDIGDRVKRGKVLAVIAMPEMQRHRQRNQ